MAINKNKVMEGAQKLVEKGQVDKAIKEYLKVVQDDPKDVRVWLKIGDLYAKKGAKPEATETYLKVAQFYSEQGFYLKAVAVYKQILKLDGRLIDVNLKLAEVYRQLGLLSDAMQQFELVAAHYHREGKTREALATIKDMVELDPENVATRIKLAELYSKEGMAGDAVAEFTRAADFLRSHSRMDDFIKVAERLVWHQPENHAINRELAELYLKRNDPRRALQKLQACFKADPRDVSTLQMLAQAFLALEQKPKTISVWKELARIHEENGQKTQAAEVYRRILQHQPDDGDALAAIGGAGTGARRAPAGTGGVPAMAMGPTQGAGPPPPAPPLVQPSPPRVASPITPAPATGQRATGSGAARPEPHIVAREVVREPAPAPVPGGKRPTGSIPIVSFDEGGAANSTPAKRGTGPAPAAPHGGRFDLDDDGPVRSGTGPTGVGGETTRRHSADEVDLDVDDFGGGNDDVVLGAGADPAEANADEIAKILTETDVYTKYGLHQKAIEHLKKVFQLAPSNIEAREKLKDVFVALGRNTEAVTELARLAEQVAPQSPDQAVAYLRELFALAPGDTRGEAVVQRYRLPVDTGMSLEVEANEFDAPDMELDPGEAFLDDSSAVSELEAELEVSAGDLGSGLAVAAQAEVGVEFDELGFDAPEPGRELEGGLGGGDIVASTADVGGNDLDFELDDFGSSDDGGALAVPPRAESTQVVSEDQVEMAIEDDVVPTAGHDEATRFESPRLAASASMDNAFDVGGGEWEAELPDVPPVPELAYVAAPVESSTLDNTFDGPGLDMTLDGETAAALADSVDGVPTSEGEAEAPTSGGGGALEDELDEADFFVGQGLFSEARDILTGLLGRYPNHPLVMAKLQDVDAMDQGGGEEPAPPAPAPAPAPVAAPPAPAPVKRPTVIARPLGDSDADTHYDLGLAYKEMGLHDEAIKEFHLVRDTPGRAVQCHLMIGLCQAERGKMSEAVTEFKNGLYVEGINDRESMAIYFELGSAYDALGDAREALYYFEKVAKRDPRFRDVNGRIEAVKGKLKGAGGRLPNDATIDAASGERR